MTIVETRAVSGRVDTHADTHVAAALDSIGGLLGVEEFPTTPAGYAAEAGRYILRIRRYRRMSGVDLTANRSTIRMARTTRARAM